MIINPEVIVTPDYPVVRFREPVEMLEKIIKDDLPKILKRNGWGIGTYFYVQFVNHEKTVLLLSALFVVTEAKENLHTSDNENQPMTKTVHTYKSQQLLSWWINRDAPVIPAEEQPQTRKQPAPEKRKTA